MNVKANLHLHCFRRESSGWLQRLTSFLNPGPLHYLIHAQRLCGLEVLHFRYVWAIDDFEAELTYQSNQFWMHMGWEGELFLEAGPEVPADLFRKISLHLDQYSWVAPWKVENLRRRFARPAKTTWIEK